MDSRNYRKEVGLIEELCRLAGPLERRAYSKEMTVNKKSARRTVQPLIEPLEGRQLLSGHHGHLRGGATITLNEAPTAVQTGLDTLAGSTLADTTVVHLANRDGLELYSVDVSGTGMNSVFTVDVDGVAISDPTRSTTTFGDLQTSDAAASDELSAIATAENLTAPATDTNISVNTSPAGLTTYTIRLTGASSTGSTGHRHARSTAITVDADGNPAGNEIVPFSVLTTDIQNGLNDAAPAGATALTDASNVQVAVKDGVELYSATFRATGVRTIVTVDNTGTLTSLPSRQRVQFSTIPPAAQTELQTLATDKGFTGTIDPTTKVTEYDEANGNVVYSVSVQVPKTRHNGGGTFNVMATVSSDANGNPTVPPDDGGFGGFAFGNRRHHR
jgi:hypothetical protein